MMNDGQEYAICPFDEVHIILKHRMPRHIMQCRKNYPNSNLVTCPFNQIHLFPPSEIEEHKRECDDRIHLERQVYQVGPKPQSIDNLIPVNVPVLSDDWDTNEQSYLAVKDERNRQRPILLMGETNVGKATRKNFHRSEQQRHLDLQNKKN